MSRASDCGLDQSLYPSQFFFNEVATNLATAFIIITSIIYCWNILYLLFSNPGTPTQRPEKYVRCDFAANILSGFLASVVAIVLIFGTWPQPLEGAALLVVVLAQASVLGWQDHDPRNFGKDLLEKLPDVAAVIVAAYALGNARDTYEQVSGNTFFHNHDPDNQMIIAYVLIGTGSLLGFVQEVMFMTTGTVAGRKLKHRSLPNQVIISSVLFLALQIATSTASIRFGASTVPDGCDVFNVTKISAMVTLGLGVFYSGAITVMRGRLDPL